MPNKCTKCGKLHSDDANYLLSSGCDACGGRFFFFVREGQIQEIEEEVSHITKTEMKSIEKDIRSMLPIKARTRFAVSVKEPRKDGNEIKIKKREEKAEKPKVETVILDIEAIRVIKPGKYHINVERLLKQKPIVVKVGEGKYEIDFSVLVEKFKAK